MREELEESARAVVKMEQEQAVVGALVDASSVEIPDSLVERELTSELESIERTLSRQGLKLDRYLEYLDKSIDQWMAGERPEAESRLKVDLVMAEYARQEGLEPSEEDVVKFLEEQAAEDEELKTQVDELKKSTAPGVTLPRALRRRRVLDRLLQIAGA